MSKTKKRTDSRLFSMRSKHQMGVYRIKIMRERDKEYISARARCEWENPSKKKKKQIIYTFGRDTPLSVGHSKIDTQNTIVRALSPWWLMPSLLLLLLFAATLPFSVAILDIMCLIQGRIFTICVQNYVAWIQLIHLFYCCLFEKKTTKKKTIIRF